MGLRFEWDQKKAAQNVKKHGISFEEASTVFGDSLSLTIQDHSSSIGEERFLIVGSSSFGKLLVVAHTEKGDTIRIISARSATRWERDAYEEGKK